MQLEGRHALITGAGSGIGRALAIEAARRGVTVALSGRRAAALRETAAAMRHGNRHFVLPGDLTCPAVRHAIGRRLARTWGRLDLLVNNAGDIHIGPVNVTSDDDIARVMAINVTAPAALTRELLSLLTKASPSRIVNVGSVFGDIAYPFFGIYSASKYALRGLSAALRRELRPCGVGVTYAAPRATRTPAAHALDPLIEPMGIRLDEPDTVARSIWRAVERDADTVYARGPERMFVLVERLFPKLVDMAAARLMADLRVKAYLDSICCSTRAAAREDAYGIAPALSSCASRSPASDGARLSSQTLDISEEHDDA